MSTSVTSRVKRPVIRYHGGKWKLAPWIISHFPSHRVYVEPFGGGASVLMRKDRAYAEIYNDLDGEIVNVFRVLRDSADRLCELIRLTPFAREEFSLSYVRTDDVIEQARRTIARAFMGFGSDSASRAQSGFRSNSNRSGTTPAHDWANYPQAVRMFSDRLAGVVIENRDSAEVLQRHDCDSALHYVDPPYPHSTRQASTLRTGKGYIHEMTDDQHRELAHTLKQLRGMVFVSGYPCEMYQELYAGWHRIQREHHADGALDRTEVLWISPNTPLNRGLFHADTQEQPPSTVSTLGRDPEGLLLENES